MTHQPERHASKPAGQKHGPVGRVARMPTTCGADVVLKELQRWRYREGMTNKTKFETIVVSRQSADEVDYQFMEDLVSCEVSHIA